MLKSKYAYVTLSGLPRPPPRPLQPHRLPVTRTRPGPTTHATDPPAGGPGPAFIQVIVAGRLGPSPRLSEAGPGMLEVGPRASPVLHSLRPLWCLGDCRARGALATVPGPEGSQNTMDTCPFVDSFLCSKDPQFLFIFRALIL